MTGLPELRIELASAADSLERAGRRVSEVIRAIDEPATPTRGLDWTLGELSAHLAARTSVYLGFLDGSAVPQGEIGDIADENVRTMRPLAHHTMAELADAVRANVDGFARATHGRLTSDPFPWYSGLTLDVGTGAGLLLGELLVHGFDLSRTLGGRWPFAQEDAATILRASLALAPSYVDRDAARGVDVTYRLSVRGIDPLRVRIADGALEVLSGAVPADCTIRADAATLVLLGYGRVGKWRAASRLKILPSGRRPWLAMRFDRYVRRP